LERSSLKRAADLAAGLSPTSLGYAGIMRIGLVLGAGGVTGGAYLAGTLAALETDLRWDVRTADIIVGTSAGSMVGALLRSDVPAGDLAAWAIGGNLSPDAIDLLGLIARPRFEPVQLRQFVRPLRVPRPSSFWSALRHPTHFDPMRAILTHLADGNRDLRPDVAFLGDGWPEQPFYCCAVRRSNGTRVVFGRDRIPTAGLSAAVAASCAVPGYFAPVDVDGSLYLDGGVASPTNAATLRDADLDLVIAVSPMSSAAPRSGYSVEGYMRENAGRKLQRELSVLESRGISTVTFQPGPSVLEHLGADFMNDANSAEIVLAAFMETGEQLRDAALPELFAQRPPLQAAV
jgi:NTE family protein